jgi:hypothetical protein
MSTIFVDNDKSTFISEEKSTVMYFLLNYRLIKIAVVSTGTTATWVHDFFSSI